MRIKTSGRHVELVNAVAARARNSSTDGGASGSAGTSHADRFCPPAESSQAVTAASRIRPVPVKKASTCAVSTRYRRS